LQLSVFARYTSHLGSPLRAKGLVYDFIQKTYAEPHGGLPCQLARTTNQEGKGGPGLSFPFGGAEAMKEMMKKWCSPQSGGCNYCPMTKMTKDEESK
jgi:hypothetical protein